MCSMSLLNCLELVALKNLRVLTNWLLSRVRHRIIKERRRYSNRVIIKDGDLDPANIANRAIYVRAPGGVIFSLHQILSSCLLPADGRGLVDRVAAIAFG